MATKTVNLDDTAYTKLDTTSESAIDCQNTGGQQVRVIFAGSLPAVGATGYYILNPSVGVSRNGKGGDMYARAESGSASVTVGE